MIVATAWILHTFCDEKRFYKDIYIYGSQLLRFYLQWFLQIFSHVFWAFLKTPFDFWPGIIENKILFSSEYHVCQEIVVKH